MPLEPQIHDLNTHFDPGSPAVSRRYTHAFFAEPQRFRHGNLDLAIRPLVDTDIPKVRLLVNQAYKELADLGLNYTATYQDEKATRERVGKGRCFVLLKDTNIIGTVLYSVLNYYTNRKTAYVSQLAVSPKYKRSGLGTLLMGWCEQLAAVEGFEGIQLDTAKPATHLMNWNKSHGYIIVGETHWEGKTYDTWIFEKQLFESQPV